MQGRFHESYGAKYIVCHHVAQIFEGTWPILSCSADFTIVAQEEAWRHGNLCQDSGDYRV